MNTLTKETLTSWANDPAAPVAVHLKQKLTSVECINDDDRCIIYPPTYADIGYNIDTLSDGKKVALVDSVGSQANRMEPVFKSTSEKPEDWLVPQIQIALGKDTKDTKATRLSLLDLAHRGADAVVQSSGQLAKDIRAAFSKLRETGDAAPLCAIAPTSLVFGVWDSRGSSSEKRPRLIRSVIRAWDVEVLHAAAQFNSVWKELDEKQRKELQDEAKKQKKKLSVKGFADAPATFRDTKAAQYVGGAPNPEARVLGGVLVHGGIERTVTINLVALRGLQGANKDETKSLRTYLLSLALIAATSEIDLFLREGCHLRFTGDDRWFSVPRRGNPIEVDLGGEAAGIFNTAAKDGAKQFRTKWPKEMNYTFDVAEAKKLLAAKEEDEQPES
ncbi:MAG: type I-G CRISPR-associated RAMP protein Csb1/Cas7g [Verrucomicrobiales bacterium]